MKAEPDELCFELHFGCDLAEADVLARLQEVLSRVAPRIAATLEVHAYERDPARRRVDLSEPDGLRAAVLAKGAERGATFQALAHGQENRLRKLRFGHVTLRGRGGGTKGVYLKVDFDRRVPAIPSGTNWLWSNNISGRILAPRVEGVDQQEWVCRLIDEVATATTMVWGAAYLSPEFARSNIDTSRGIRAIGRDMRRSLPGVYWLNVFGPPYIDLIGERRLLDAPADAVKRRGEHIVISTYGNAEDWEAHDKTRYMLATALGAEYFFDRDDRARQHQAPDFGLPELPERPPFRVQTEDGIHFTPLQ
ncbi:hypothetical protein GCM10023176_24700 [Micromonospora coerulea]|uniref:Uncharacterized protein n=1 Tax=Micromonospora coerulea TaxID=47856 RepID=A0ABP8SH30_9ACTN